MTRDDTPRSIDTETETETETETASETTPSLTERLPWMRPGRHLRNLLVGIGYFYTALFVVMGLVLIGALATDGVPETAPEDTPPTAAEASEDRPSDDAPRDESKDTSEHSTDSPPEESAESEPETDAVSPEMRALVMQRLLTDEGIEIEVWYSETGDYYAADWTTQDADSLGHEIGAITGAYTGAEPTADLEVNVVHPNGTDLGWFEVRAADAQAYRAGEIDERAFIERVFESLIVYD